MRLGIALRGIPREEVWITVVTPYEQLRSALSRINSAKTSKESVVCFGLFLMLLDHYASEWRGRILPFDDRAAQWFLGFDAKLIRRIGRRDAQIAAIALVHGATLVTANVSDFQAVSGLVVENWLPANGDAAT